MAKKLTPIGKQVGDARRGAGLSQEQLAAKIGITRGFLAKLEANMGDAQNPTLNLLLALAVVLPSLDWFSEGLSPQLAARRKELQVPSGKRPRAKKPA